MSKRKNKHQTTDKLPSNGAAGIGVANGTNSANGHSGGNGAGDNKLVPGTSEQMHSQAAPQQPMLHETQPLPVFGANGADGNGNGNGNSNVGERARVQDVRPVKVRVGHVNGNGNGSANGNGHHSENGVKARVSGEAVGIAENGHASYTGHATTRLPNHTTSRLRDTDLTSVRLRLKTGEWKYKDHARRGPGQKRQLPYFMMRHRNLRARSRVGYIRSQVAARKYGRGGVITVIARVLALVILLNTLMVGTGVGAAVGGVGWYLGTLPKVDPGNLVSSGLAVQTTKIYDRNGVPLLDLVDEQTGLREEVTLDKVAPLVISATIAAEDATFYTNLGVDPVGIVRAVTINLSGEGRSGASTITQQVVRQVVLGEKERTEQTLARKIKEAVLALQMTREYSKNDIMELYLNQNYYGHRAYGIAAAARTYFDKEPDQLNLAEAALLAGLPQAPSEYDPFVNGEQARRRRAIVLDLMVKQDMITQEEADAAKNTAVELKSYQPPLRAPHFVYYVKEYLEKKYGPTVDELGLQVYTSLDVNVQDAAEKVARDRIEELRRQKATNASIVIMKPGTGEILAMVGSVDYNDTSIDGQVNVATRERQPGSSFKPITFATAFKKGWTPATVVLDTLTAFPNAGQKPYAPNNYDGRDHGWVTVRDALANSYNVPAVKALQFAGIQETIDTAHDMGIKGLNRGLSWYGLSLTLGGGEVTLLDMTTAYSTFANGGMAVDADPILRIIDSQNRVLYCNGAYLTAEGACSETQVSDKIQGKQALDPRHAFMITSILSDNRARSAAFGANSPLRVSFPAAAKTGTTDDNRDSWTMGYTPNLTVGVWVGNSNNAEMLKVTGAIGAAVIWHNMMETFYKNPEFVKLASTPDGKLAREFVQPDGLVKASACSARGGVTDLFLKEALPGKKCTTYQDPKTNKALRSAPSNQQQRPRATPAPRQAPAKPTPLPGIFFPTPA
ncbi:MAG TPA: PBP1A family penicillin-binding protein, partial [Chloroflexia bacterium]|nr:PBP1A family penicillin-binding protein [Chloroflexia bacterium]